MSNKRLNAVITIGGAISGTFKSAIGGTKSALGSVGESISKITARQKELNAVIKREAELGKAGSALKVQYANQELALLDKKLLKLKLVKDRLSSIDRAQSANAARRADLRGGVLDAVAIGATVSAPIIQAAAFEKAMLGVAKQVNGARDASGKLTSVYFDMRKEIQMLGREIPIATNDLADMVAAGARMGIAREELIQFTRTAAMMGAAFDLPVAELADNMGKIATLYKIPIPEIAKLGDAINYLDDNTIAKGGDIIDFMQRVGGVASSVKISGEEMAALGSTLLTLGERAETASTATNAIFQKFSAASMGTKKFKSAMEQLKLPLKEVQKGMQVDATGTLLKVLDAIKKLPKDQQLGVMTELVGLEHSDTLAKLVNGTEEYRKELALLNDEKKKGSMQREFNATLQTTSAHFEILKNNVVEVSVNIGMVLLPAVNSLFTAVRPLFSAMADFAREHPQLTQAVVGSAVAFGSLKVVAMALGYAWTFVSGGALMLWRTVVVLAPALRLVGTAVAFIGRMLLLNPIGLAVTGIATAAFLIYKYWEPIKGFFQKLWDDITATFMTAINWITKKIESVGQAWTATKNFIGLGDSPNGAAGGAAAGAAIAAAGQNLPSVPTGGRFRAGGWTDNSTNHITVYAQPGQNNKDLADEVVKRMRERDEINKRGRLTDGTVAQ